MRHVHSVCVFVPIITDEVHLQYKDIEARCGTVWIGSGVTTNAQRSDN